MRILHISTRLILGGSQENTVLSCEGQARLGHEVHLAFGPIFGPEGSMLKRVQSFRTPTEPPAQAGGPARRKPNGSHITDAPATDPLLAQEALKESQIKTHTIPNLIRPINPLADLRCYFQLKKLIRTINPDIVHTHSSKAGILGRAAAWRVYKQTHRPAIIHTIHGPPFHKYQSNFKNLIYTLAERFAAKRCHHIVAVADAMTTQYLAKNIGKPAQYTTVRSGIETEPYQLAATPENRARVRRELNLDENDFVIGTVARLAELKGHDDLLDALADGLHANPHFKLLWVGDGWWKKRLLDRVKQLDLEKQVITTGLVPPEKIPDMMAAMDILAHSSYREGLPRTVVQALLLGLCPIANDVDGTREVCKDMQTGRLVPPGDTQALGDAIRWAAANPDKANALAARGQEFCQSDFSAQTMVHQLEAVYAEAIERA
jgi:glycosyltransferase involved in cell wall biosynthesis